MTQDPGYYIEKFSENVLEAKFEHIDQATIRNTKNRILDLVGCSLSGAEGRDNADFVNMVKTWGGKEESNIFVYGGKVPAHNAAMVNSIVARTYDFEAVSAHVDGVDLASHISITTVFTALAMGEAHNISGKELLTALLVGDDLACRLLAASGFGFTKGWDGNGTVNAIGAAAIAGRILGLSKKQMKNAFGIVLNQLSGSFQNIWDGTLCFRLPCALSSRNGIISAEMANIDWDGPFDPLFSKFGYFSLFTDGCADMEILTKNMGRKFYTEAIFKPYPSCRANHAAIDCALSIVKENNVDTRNIADILLRVPPRVRDMFVGQTFMLRENPKIDAAFSIRFSVANALLRKRLVLEDFQEDLLNEAEIADLANMIRIEGFEPHELSEKAASLLIKMKDGQEYYTQVKFILGGSVENSLTDDDIKNKFRYNLGYSQKITEKTGEKIIELIENLEEVKNISDLTACLSS